MNAICVQVERNFFKGFEFTACVSEDLPEARETLLREAREQFPGCRLRLVRELPTGKLAVVPGSCVGGCGCGQHTCKGRNSRPPKRAAGPTFRRQGQGPNDPAIHPDTGETTGNGSAADERVTRLTALLYEAMEAGADPTRFRGAVAALLEALQSYGEAAGTLAGQRRRQAAHKALRDWSAYCARFRGHSMGWRCVMGRV
jgi:hypothetical protein